MPEETSKFDQWAVVELFGHQRTAGRVSEQIVAGQGFVRVDVPAVEDQEGFSRLFGPGAIYSIIPTSEEIVRAYVARNVGTPIQPYMLRLPEPAREEDDSGDYYGPDDSNGDGEG